jgi:hypothetical protein
VNTLRNIRAALQRNKPLGNDRFRDEIAAALAAAEGSESRASAFDSDPFRDRG